MWLSSTIRITSAPVDRLGPAVAGLDSVPEHSSDSARGDGMSFEASGGGEGVENARHVAAVSAAAKAGTSAAEAMVPLELLCELGDRRGPAGPSGGEESLSELVHRRNARCMDWASFRGPILNQVLVYSAL